MNNLIFVYGTLKTGHGNHRRWLSRATFCGAATTTDKFTLVDFGAFPAVTDTPMVQITGELFEVDDATLADLDILEGHPDWYRRRQINVLARGTALVRTAWMYIMPASTDSQAATSRGRIVASGQWNPGDRPGQ